MAASALNQRIALSLPVSRRDRDGAPSDYSGQMDPQGKGVQYYNSRPFLVSDKSMKTEPEAASRNSEEDGI